jgi:hypothetical protein
MSSLWVYAIFNEKEVCRTLDKLFLRERDALVYAKETYRSADDYSLEEIDVIK